VKRLLFYPSISFLIILDSLLLSRPNFIGKVGLAIYHYNYLKTFPKALLTVSIGTGLAIVTCEAVIYFATRGKMGRRISNVIFLTSVVVSSGLLIRAAVEFSSGAYSHSGIQFRIGACMLPFILLLVFLFGLTKLPKRTFPTPESALVEEAKRIINQGN
jgi:hypothetical protein